MPPGEPIHELDDTVMADLQALGERPDRGGPTAVESFHLQQQLILLGRDPGGARRDLADALEPPQLVSEVG